MKEFLSKFGGVDIQWFSDEDAPDLEFEETGDEEPEIVLIRDGEPGPEPEEEKEDEGPPELTAEERIAKAVEAGLSNIKLPGNQQPAQNPVPPPDDKEFWGNFKEELFGDNVSEVFQKGVEKIVSKVQAQNQVNDMRLYRKLMENDPVAGKVLKNHSEDVQSVLNSIPANARNTPEALDYAIEKARLKNLDDEIEERIQAAVAEAVKGTEKKVVSRKQFNEAGAGGGGAKGRPRKEIRYSEADVVIADRKGIPLEEYLSRKGK
jgi:hypothetical protein